jgi:hypothetical protein
MKFLKNIENTNPYFTSFLTRKTRICIYGLLFTSILPILSQEDDLYSESQIIQNTIEELLEATDSENFDYNTIFEQLTLYHKNPIDINETNEDQLKNLFLLNEVQIANFISYKRELGDFLSIQELQSIPGWDLGTIRNVLPFMVCRKKETSIGTKLKDAWYNGESTLYVKAKRVLQQRSGFIHDASGDPVFAGDPYHGYVRYRYQSGQKFQAGFTAEKDPGERFFGKGSKYGFDFYSFFVYMKDINSKFRAVALGDFAVSFGQGLILHNDFGAGKSSFVMNVKKSGRTLRPYSSVNEVNFFRGFGAIVQLAPKVQSTVFVSYKPIDASVDTDTIENSDFDAFGSIRFDGFHRTITEINNKDAIHQMNVGGKVQYKDRDFQIGCNALYTRFDASWIRDEALYRKYLFTGGKLANFSSDYSYRYRNYTFFGEVALSDNLGMAQLHGLLSSLDRNVDVSIVYRDYDRDYHVLNANAFGEASLPINEQGVYLGMEIRPKRGWSLSFYADHWKNPWVTYRRDGSTFGREYLAKIAYNIKRKLDFYIQYRYEQKQINSSNLTKIDFPLDIELQRLRLHLSYKLTKEWELRQRAEWSYFTNQEITGHKNGFLLFQDIIYKPISKPFSFSSRYAIFDVNGFDARIYAYENDLLYEFYIPFYQNKGIRYYLNARYRINRNITAEARIGEVRYQNVDEVGSGYNKISGNKLTEIKAQIKYKF